MMAVRWLCEQGPVYPEDEAKAGWFRHRKLYDDVLKVVKDSPGITTGDVARALNRLTPAPALCPST